ncbi:MAG: SRPBCC domain-containing protein [Aridibacter sp.]
MFTIKASHTEAIEINANLEKVHDFFSDIGNFKDLMPHVESIRKDSKNVIHWKIRVDVPLVGSFSENFSVIETENSPDQIEWSPAKGEKYNLLRYSADFMSKSGNKTLVQISQSAVLNRNSASDFHLLAGLVGENLISNEMSRNIALMLKDFAQNARQKIESRED